MVKKSNRKSVTNIRVILGIECVQQHRLVIADLNIERTTMGKKKPAPRLKLRKLMTEEGEERYQARLQEKAEAVSTATSIEEKWSAMKNAWLDTAVEICGRTKGFQKQRETWWWNDKVAEAVKKKREKFKKWKRTKEEEDHREYLEAKRD